MVLCIRTVLDSKILTTIREIKGRNRCIGIKREDNKLGYYRTYSHQPPSDMTSN